MYISNEIGDFLLQSVEPFLESIIRFVRHFTFVGEVIIGASVLGIFIVLSLLNLGVGRNLTGMASRVWIFGVMFLGD